MSSVDAETDMLTVGRDHLEDIITIRKSFIDLEQIINYKL